MFDIGRVGLPCALVGAAVLLVFGRRLLPNRTELIEQYDKKRREYLVEMKVQPQCRLIGQSVEQAGLRHLPGLFLIEISRGDDLITPVSPQDVIHEGDRLVFTGVVTTIVDLEKIPGLVPTPNAEDSDPAIRQQRHLTEAVLSRSSPLIGRTVRDAHFRQQYGAAVVAVHRDGVRLTNKIGNIVLEPGDTLLLQTRMDFVSAFRHSRDFYLVSSVEGSTAVRHDRASLAVALVAALIAWMVAASWITGSGWQGFGSHAIAALTIAGLMVACRCLPISMARGALDIHVLLTLAAAIGLGRALTESGAASAIAQNLTGAVGDHPYLLLVVLYVLTMILTELVTNNAVAAMLIPLAVALAASSDGYNPRPFVMAVALAASLSFLSPVGYQTNLMVMGPGGYRPRDYLKAGWPVALSVTVVALLLIPYWWPLRL
jgi:di/tricarboxylate transporter